MHLESYYYEDQSRKNKRLILPLAAKPHETLNNPKPVPTILFYSEIFQQTGPIQRAAIYIAGHGYAVLVPEVFHELNPIGTVLGYDDAGRIKGNDDKAAKDVQGKIKALYNLDDAQIVRTDASFVMGASGSPVFDSNGKLIAISTFKSPGRGAYYYNIPVKWIKALIDAPESIETTSMKSEISPFWDALDENRPFFMRVVMPYQNEKWDELLLIANAWVKAEPDCAEAHYYLGIAHEKLADMTQAKSEFAQSLKLHPMHTATLFELGLIAKSEGNEPELERLKLAMQTVDNDVLLEFNETLNPTLQVAE